MQRRRHESKSTLSSESLDESTIKQIQAGHQEAFDLLIRRYQRPLLGFIYHYLAEYDLACDITQNVFLQLYLSLPTLHANGSLKGWLYRVARNRCLDELRRKRVTPFSHLEVAEGDEDLSPLANLQDPAPLPEEMAEQQELRSLLHQAIDGLPSKYRAVVLSRYTGQLSIAETALALHMPEGTVKTYFQRARPLLHAALTSLRMHEEIAL
jgi:RNA polymerase sigma-70 factor, ECF subfamily